MISPEDYSDIMVTISHPWADIEIQLDTWIERGPGPRPWVGILSARRKSTGEPVPLDEIPLEYHNSAESRKLQREGKLPCPWGPPPETEPYMPNS